MSQQPPFQRPGGQRNIVLDGLALQTTQLVIRDDGAGGHITFRAALSDTEASALREQVISKTEIEPEDQYFPVTVDGATDVLSMRFGMVVWSRADAGVKYEVTLVDERQDKKPGNSFELLSVGDGQRDIMLTRHDEMIRQLLSTLVAKALLSQEDVDAVISAGKSESRRLRFQFSEVSDVDRWPFDDGD